MLRIPMKREVRLENSLEGGFTRQFYLDLLIFQVLFFLFLGENLVHASAPISLQIQRHIHKAQALETLHNLLPQFVVEDPMEILLADLDTGGFVVVVADAEEPESVISHERFGSIDFHEVLLCDTVAIRKSG